MATYTQRKEPKSLADKLHEKAVAATLIHAACDDSDWPECVKCGDAFNPKRKALGYDCCLSCGEPKKNFAVVPVPKSNYVIASDISQVVSPYSHKGNR